MSTMSPGKRKQIEPLGKSIEAVLSPGHFISDNAAWSFVADVQGVADDIDKEIHPGVKVDNQNGES